MPIRRCSFIFMNRRALSGLLFLALVASSCGDGSNPAESYQQVMTDVFVNDVRSFVIDREERRALAANSSPDDVWGESLASFQAGSAEYSVVISNYEAAIDRVSGQLQAAHADGVEKISGIALDQLDEWVRLQRVMIESERQQNAPVVRCLEQEALPSDLQKRAGEVIGREEFAHCFLDILEVAKDGIDAAVRINEINAEIRQAWGLG